MENPNMQDMIASIMKDFEKFSQNFLYIRSKESTISPLMLNKEQKYIHQKLNQQKQDTGRVRALILKGRQIGATTYATARCYHHSVSHIGSKSMVMCHRQSATDNIFDMINRYHGNSPNFLKPKAEISKGKSINFKNLNSSYVFATAGGSEVGRSETIQFFHGSEVAFWENADNHLSSILMSVPDCADTEVILESTSNGSTGLFYNMCMEAHAGRSEYQLIFLPWHWHEEYVAHVEVDFSEDWLVYQKTHKLSTAQLTWAYIKNRNLCANNLEDVNKPSAQFHREFPATIHEAFAAVGSNKLIPLSNLLAKSIKKKDFQQGSHEESSMILGVDVAFGGGDFSWIVDRCGNFLGFNVNEKINTSDTMELVGILTRLIEKHEPTKVCIDAGGGGVGVYDRLAEIFSKDILELVHFSSRAANPKKYVNRRAEMWGLLGEFIKEDGYIVYNDTLLQQISSAEYGYNSSGQLKLESKDEIKKRLKASPDGADACVLTFAAQGNHIFTKVQLMVEQEEFDPFTW
ncbi:MAG: hypothetical protein LBQ34_07040 [Alphaproteobacteria bacterium]|jgi:hypothetical protein|nr:hypothetical protein [Alphaproteobacteria bacterium]